MRPASTRLAWALAGVLAWTGFAAAGPEDPPAATSIREVPLERRRALFGRPVTGIAIDRNGKRVSGLEVEIVLDPHAQKPTPVRARTDAQGRFELPRIPSGEHRVRPVDSDAAVGPVTVRVSLFLDPAPVLLCPKRAGEFVVVVLDDDGSPVPRVPVSLTSSTHRRSFGRSDSSGLAKLDVRGRTQLVGCGPEYAAERPEHAAGRTYVRGADVGGAILVLPRTVLLTGRVLTPRGRPFGSGQVEFRSWPPLEVAAYIDARGQFQLRVPRDRTGSLHLVQPTGETRFWTGLLLDVRGPKSDLVMQVSELRTDCRLVVRVETPDGQPLRGAHVQLTGGLDPDDPTGTTSDDGRVTFENVEGRQLDVTATLPDAHADAARWSFANPTQVVPDDNELVVRALPSARVTGRVVTPDGAPVPGAVVAWRNERSRIFAYKADSKGVFEFTVPARKGLRGELLVSAKIDGKAYDARTAFQVPELVTMDIVVRSDED